MALGAPKWRVSGGYSCMDTRQLHGTRTVPCLVVLTVVPPASGPHKQSSIEEIDLDHNQLTGSAFPPAWLAPNSTLNLESLWLSNNPGLEGSLPPSLNWSRLRVM